jgi:protein ImuB
MQKMQPRTVPVSNSLACDEPPLALVHTVASRQMIVAVNESARQSGIRFGMTLSEARAICAAVMHAEHDPHRDTVALEALGRWMMRFSPVVSIAHARLDGQGAQADARQCSEFGLYLDVTGCERIFGGLENLIKLVGESLKKFRISAGLAIAPTPGAAWALASCHDARIVPPEKLFEALEKLPPIQLRIESQTAKTLHHLGLNTIGQVMHLPRQGLPARFGDELLLRIDQALGRIAEPLLPLEPFSPITARIDFEGPIDSLETIWEALKELIGKTMKELARRGRGARQVQVEFFRAYESPLLKTIYLSRASRDAVNLFNLLRCAMETLGKIQPPGRQGARIRLKSPARSQAPGHPAHSMVYQRVTPDGFSGIRLAISQSEKIVDEQIALLEHEDFAGQMELNYLIERLRARLGRNIVMQAQAVASYLPEKAWKPVEINPSSRSSAASSPQVIRAVRPLQLLSLPQEIRVMVSPSDDQEGGRPVSMTLNNSLHRLEQIVGPERIAGVWWDGRDKTRDYFDVEDSSGKRFWIFRVLQTARWYLHGRFS